MAFVHTSASARREPPKRAKPPTSEAAQSNGLLISSGCRPAMRHQIARGLAERSLSRLLGEGPRHRAGGDSRPHPLHQAPIQNPHEEREEDLDSDDASVEFNRLAEEQDTFLEDALGNMLVEVEDKVRIRQLTGERSLTATKRMLADADVGPCSGDEVVAQEAHTRFRSQRSPSPAPSSSDMRRTSPERQGLTVDRLSTHDLRSARSASSSARRIRIVGAGGGDGSGASAKAHSAPSTTPTKANAVVDFMHTRTQLRKTLASTIKAIAAKGAVVARITHAWSKLTPDQRARVACDHEASLVEVEGTITKLTRLLEEVDRSHAGNNEVVEKSNYLRDELNLKTVAVEEVHGALKFRLGEKAE